MIVREMPTNGKAEKNNRFGVGVLSCSVPFGFTKSQKMKVYIHEGPL